MPELTVIAGCNGAGKSTFAPSFLKPGIVSFDYDKLYLSYYKNLPDSEFREEFAKHKATRDFEDSIQKSITERKDFCYETNFDEYPIHWPELFRKNGYSLNLIFFCLDNQDIARHRIQVRTEFKGHFVDNKTIDLKWKAGYKNVNKYFSFFDNVLFVDNSLQNELYKNILQFKEGEIEQFVKKLPGYFSRRLPEVYKLLK